jgi:hypothetical protein
MFSCKYGEHVTTRKRDTYFGFLPCWVCFPPFPAVSLLPVSVFFFFACLAPASTVEGARLRVFVLFEEVDRGGEARRRPLRIVSPAERVSMAVVLIEVVLVGRDDGAMLKSVTCDVDSVTWMLIV